MTEISPDAQRLLAVLATRAHTLDMLTDADWERLVALALEHDVAAVLYARLKEAGLTFPPAVAKRLRDAYLASAARNVRLFHELGKILRALQAASIAVIPLKGACLAEAVYGNVALRPMADVDLLVKSGDVAGALDVLRVLGYAPEAPLDPVAEQTINHGVPMIRPGAVRVDLHWTVLTPRYHGGFGSEDLELLWSRAEPATIGGVPVLMCSPTDLLLHLCLHVSVGHRFGTGLLSYLDIAEVSRRYSDAIDWEQFSARANTWGIANGVRLALQLAGEWTGLVIPPHVLPSLNADPPDDATVDWVRHKAFEGTSLALQGDAVRFAGKTRLVDNVGLMRDAMAPFLASLAGIYRSPAASWRSLRAYSGRLTGYLGRHRQVLWRIVRRDKTFLADARKEARLREYLGWR